MSLAGGSYLGLSDSEAAAGPGSKRDPPSVAMPNVLDQCYAQKNPNRPLQKWPNAGKTTQLTNGKKEGKFTVALSLEFPIHHHHHEDPWAESP